MSDHNKESLQFWITCPGCGEKFGVPPGTVFKYMERLADGYVKEVNKRVESYEKTVGEEEGS